MRISQSLEIIDLAIYHRKKNSLIIGDIHIGYEESLNKQGMLIPRFQFKKIIERLKKIFAELKKPDQIIINGDLKHEFGTISEQEWRHTLALLDFLAQHCREIILIKGNHDTIIGPIAHKRNIQIIDLYVLHNQIKSGYTNQRKKEKNILILHGDKIPDKIPEDIKTIIIGHEHPAISLRDGPRVETYKCFLKGTYKNKELIVMPSFNLVSEGTDVLREEVLSPFMAQNLDTFKVFIVADKVYDFGRIKEIKK